MSYGLNRPEFPVEVRIHFDSGSQWSYLTNKMRSILQVPSESSETMMIKTFGSDVQKIQSCDVVRVAIKTKDGENLELPLLTVPLICEPLIGQPLSYTYGTYSHIAELDLADPPHDHCDLTVSILIGLDHYWRLVSGEVIR